MFRVVGLRLQIFALSALILLICAGACLAQELAYNEQAEFDKDGNILVSSSGGGMILMGNTARYVEASVAADRFTPVVWWGSYVEVHSAICRVLWRDY